MGSLNLPTNVSGQVVTVPDFASLPPADQVPIGSERVTEDSGTLYINDGSSWNSAGGGSGIVSVNGNAGSAQVFLAGTGLGINNTGPVHTYSLTSPVAIANGGTASGNAQQALNTLFNIGSHTNSDVVQLLTGNVQLAPLDLTVAQVSAAVAAPANCFIFTDAGSQLAGYGNWHIDPATFFSRVDNFLHPNNVPESPVAYSWNVNVAPLQNSPDDSMRLQSLTVGLDTSATGFSFGTNGQAAELLGGGYNYGGNGASFGVLRNINLFTSLGDGTNPGTFGQMVASAHSYNINPNITLDGQISGYDFNVNVNAAAVTTSNFNVLWLSDFSQYPVDVYGYQGWVCQPNIATIKNGHNFNGNSITPTIGVMEGDAGFYGYNISGSITTLGTSGWSGLGFNTSIGTVPATGNVVGLSLFNQIGTMTAGSNFHGSNISPTVTALHGNMNHYEAFPVVTGGDGAVALYSGGMSQVHTTGQTSVLNLNGLTADGNQSQFAADGVRMNIGGRLDAADNQGVQGQHVLFTEYHTPASTTITGTDVICNILSPNVDFGDATSHLTLGPSGLGFNFVGFAGQMSGHGTIDQVSAVIPAAIFADDFTLPEFRNVNGLIINAGYTGSCTNASIYYGEIAGAGLFATNHWGLRIVTDIDNYTTKFKMGDGSQKADPAAVLDLESTTKGFAPPSMTTVQKLAITSPPERLTVYDLTLHQLSYYNGTTWVNV